MKDEEGGAFRPRIPAHPSPGFYTFAFTLPLQDT